MHNHALRLPIYTLGLKCIFTLYLPRYPLGFPILLCDVTTLVHAYAHLLGANACYQALATLKIRASTVLTIVVITVKLVVWFKKMFKSNMMLN